MNQPATDLAPASQANSLISQIPSLRQEIRRRPVLLAGIFAAIALLALVVGVAIPKRFASSTTILVEENNIIQPLMEGRAVPTGIADRAAITREVASSRKVMQEVLKVGGWMDSNPSPVQQDKLIDTISSRIDITNPAENLIQISYTDSSPTRAYAVTKRLADLVISESLAAKERESRQAFEFINQQVGQYHAKLTDAERKLEAYRTVNPDARPGVSADVNARIGELRRTVETERLDLIDQRSDEAALRAQLGGESKISAVESPVTAMQAQLMDMQAQRRKLLLTYTDQYPDVVQLTQQIGDLQQMIDRAEDQQQRGASSPGRLNDSAELNPLYAELRSKLAEAQRQSAATDSKIASAQAMLNDELTRASNIGAAEGALAELTRDYEVNQDLYQDLLKRRENARVSMNLDHDHQGLTFRIQEPAAMPLRPQGLRLMYVAIAGLLLALLVPLGVLLGLVRLDPRARSVQQIEAFSALPVVAVVPRYRSAAIRRADKRARLHAILLLLSVPVLYAIVMVIRWTVLK